MFPPNINANKNTPHIVKKTNKSVFALLNVSKRTPNEGKYIVKILKFLMHRNSTAIEEEFKY